MPAHSSLTGSDLHECKGANSATANTVRVSDGSGSGTWQKLTSDSINTSSIKNINKESFIIVLKSISDPSATVYIPLDISKTLASVKVIVNSTDAGNFTVAIKKNGSTVSSGTLSSTSEGDILDISVGVSYTTSDTLNLALSGTSTSGFTVLLKFTI